MAVLRCCTVAAVVSNEECVAVTADLRRLPVVQDLDHLQRLLEDGTITSAENRYVDLKRNLDGKGESTAKVSRRWLSTEVCCSTD